ncbi:MAG: GTP-binding protein [Schleiferiaceae bacterium]|nr:GTP-binding protein [Schleiferiaceae bacterium]MDG1758785.1 GTP-binding protein [Schleiferiaceae bacterium]MDG2225863.1 GTP-binding protein [Schleiferiaceae bacterium]
MNILRFTTAGSVDDGKSTLIGRLLYDSKSVYIDQVESIEKTSKRKGLGRIDFSLLTDGLKDEREQGITIDVAYRYFATPIRKFIIADTPGHVQYTRNMVTGASTANAALILIDARHGVVEQTRRHSFIAGLLGIESVTVCVNKMDLVDYDESVFQAIVKDFDAVTKACKLQQVNFIPLSALMGDNVVDAGSNMPWYQGNPLLAHLEQIQVTLTDGDFRMPVQTVIRPHSDAHHDFRGYAGRVASGTVTVGDQIIVAPHDNPAIVTGIQIGDTSLESASMGQSICINLDRDIDVSRGDVIASGQTPDARKRGQATICWLDNQAQRPGSKYAIRQGSTEGQAMITVDALLDVEHLAFESPEGPLETNQIARIQWTASKPIACDSYLSNHVTGSFILVDINSGNTVAAGMMD